MSAPHNGKHRLRALNFDEVSLVTSGDDPMALQVMAKMAPEVIEEKLEACGLDPRDFKFSKDLRAGRDGDNDGKFNEKKKKKGRRAFRDAAGSQGVKIVSAAPLNPVKPVRPHFLDYPGPWSDIKQPYPLTGADRNR